MLESVVITARQTAILFVLMTFGMLAKRLGYFDRETIRRLTEFLVQVITPCLIVSSFQCRYDSSRVTGLGWMFAAALFSTAVAIALAHASIHSRDERHSRALKWATVFSNCGFMGIPLEQAIFGADGVFYGIAAIAVFNIFAWTYGVWLMGGAVGKAGLVKGMLNPANVSVAVAIPLFFLPWRIPSVIETPVETIASLNTPVAMLVMGFCLASAKFGPAFRCRSTYLMLLFRHFLVPAVLIAALAFLPGIDRTVRLASVIPAAAPIGALLTVFAVRYDADAEFSTALVALSTVFSIVTIPLVIAVAQSVF